MGLLDWFKKKKGEDIAGLQSFPTGIPETESPFPGMTPGTPPIEPLPGEQAPGVPAWKSETAPPRPMPEPKPFERVAPMHTETEGRKDHEIINLKLDAIKNALESINMRLERLENTLAGKTEREVKKVWYR
ncbi:MAG: hypothetical protein ACE5FT_00495 [Candidatus Nanoarchaeia archaeon]